MNINPIDLKLIESRAANVYEAIMVAAKQARLINDSNRIEFNALLSTIPQTNPEEGPEDTTNDEQLKMTLQFEKRKKPHLQALELLLENKIQYRYKT